MTIKSIIAAVAMVALPIVAQAATLSGQLDVVGRVNLTNSSFTAGGQVDFDPQVGVVLFGEGDFSAFAGQTFDLFDIDFSTSQVIYSGGGLTFTAASYFDFDNTSSDLGFMASGILKLAGYDDTPGVFSFSTQKTNSDQLVASFSSSTTPTSAIPLPASVFMLLASLGGLGVVSRSRRASA